MNFFIVNARQTLDQFSDVSDKNTELLVSEIFYSVQGEASYSGKNCTFVRLTGCPLRCSWCDTEYSFHGGKKTYLTKILATISDYPCTLVEITGGEPLLQKEVYSLFTTLNQGGFQILLETSGAISIDRVPSYVHIIMDLKAISSNEVEKNLFENLALLKPSDDIKVVIANHEDFLWIEEVYQSRLSQMAFRPKVFLQPSFNDLPAADLVEWIKYSPNEYQLSLQLHKYIYNPEEKGV